MGIQKGVVFGGVGVQCGIGFARFVRSGFRGLSAGFLEATKFLLKYPFLPKKTNNLLKG